METRGLQMVQVLTVLSLTVKEWLQKISTLPFLPDLKMVTRDLPLTNNLCFEEYVPFMKSNSTGRIGSRQQLAENVWLVSLGCSGGP